MRSRMLFLAALTFFSCVLIQPIHAGELRCGAAVVDVTPRHLPVIRNGGFLQAEDDKVIDPLHARCVVFDDGDNRVAIVVVDSCMLPLSLCDEVKQLAQKATGISVDRIMISATHTHTAPSVMHYCLGSGIDERYRAFLPGKIAEAIQLASKRMQPAKVAWTRVDASHFTKCRRWITRTDKMQRDPFGDLTIHANMHPGHLNADYVGPSGPIDPWLTMLLVADSNGKPMAALANLSMHYYSGHAGVSADYCGRFANEIAKRWGGENSNFVGIMSQGTSGDLWWGDYGKAQDEKPFASIEQFTDELVELAMGGIEEAEFLDDVPIRMAEERLTLKRRVPNEGRLAWAKRLNRLRGDRRPKDRPEVYALQAEYMHENPTDEVVLQAIRIGDLGITGMPNEVYGLTGLKLKRRSPLGTTFNVSLANGACGYIPPPEQHALGGYTTWPARTAGLEESAEPKIVATLLQLLEDIADKPRKEYVEPATEFSRRIIESKPYAYWRLAEMEQADGADASGNRRPLQHVGLVAYHLPGRVGDGFGVAHDSHAVQLAGGKLVANGFNVGENYSVQMSFRLGTSVDFRNSTGTLISRGTDHLQITGSGSKTPGRLMVGEQVGSTAIERNRWHQLVFVRNGDFVQVFLDGQASPELSVKVARTAPVATLMIGGDAKNAANFEGKIDELSVYDRALTKEDVSAIFEAAGLEVESASPGELKSHSLDVKSSMDRIHIREGYRVELVASEPMVVDPVAIDWGPDGKLWVAEMADYPMGMDGNGEPGGRIRFLEDINGDGRYDKSTLFMDGVSFPNGVMAWRDGVLVTAAPEIFYAEDTNNDGRADKQETLFSGFMTKNQQLRVNGLRWGLDNMVHCASGSHHAGFGASNSVFSTKVKSTIRLGSRDFRFDPDSGMLDPQSGPSQFGRVRDDFGNWFGVQNSQPLWHYVLADQYTRRNTEVPTRDARQQVRVPRMPEVYAAKPPQRRFHSFDQAGHFTSACGISIYRDELLFPPDEMHAFTCEPFHNLVQHHRLNPLGTSFHGERADDGPMDFFASSDRWTRPVMSRTGPDGALWVVDMYRYMIEHPEWLPQLGKDSLRAGYRAGDQLGRIYRIVPIDSEPNRVPNIADISRDELIDLLSGSNGVLRDMVHRELASRSVAEAQINRVREVARSTLLPESRLQALSVLDAWQAVTPEVIRNAVLDSHPAVRSHAIRLAESFPIADVEQCGVLSLVDDPDATVRLQMAASLGEWSDGIAGRSLAILAQLENDTFTDAAIVSSLPKHYETVSRELLGGRQVVRAPIMDAMLMMGEKHPEQLARILSQLMKLENETRFSQIARWLDTLADRNVTFMSLAERHDELAADLEQFEQLVVEARELSLNTKCDLRMRAAAVGIVGRTVSDYERDLSLLDKLLASDQPEEVQLAAMERLSRVADPGAADVLISHWSQFLPRQQQRASSALLGRSDWTKKLLDAIERGDIGSNDLTLAQQQTLRNSGDKQVAARAAEVLREIGGSDRVAIIQHYAEELTTGNPTAGATVFNANCSVCHSLDRTKKLVGPDLRTVTNRSRETLLTAVLDPGQSVEPKYVNYSVVLKNGEVLDGVVSDESQGSLTIVDATGKSRTALRTSIDLVKRSGKSMMPEGFESKIGPREMSDLVAYLREL